MMKKYKNYFYLVLISFFLFSCTSVKDGLTLKKKENSQQFLIETKKPLVMPPDFDDLPQPGNLETETDNQEAKNDNSNLDLETILENSNKSKKNTSENEISLEIQKKINKELQKN